MIIGVDGRELEGKSTGVGVYLLNILQRVSVPDGARLQLYFKNKIPDILPNINAEKILLKSSDSNFAWQQWRLCRELKKRKVDLFFSPGNSGPWYYPGIQVVTIHDLSFFRYPRWFSPKERILRQLNARLSLRQADRIYVVSTYVRDELKSQFDVPPPRILVTWNGVSPKQDDPAAGKVLRKSYGLDNVRIILYAGSIFNRRHLPVLMEAVSQLDETCALVVIGENRTYPRQDLHALARRLNIERRIRLLDYVSPATLDNYYKMADLFVYLSEYEGFGIPPLEAMSYGVPVVLSATPAMNQIYSDAAYFVKDFSPVTIRDAIQHCLTDAAERDDLVRAGKALANRYSWDETARVISMDWEQFLVARS